MLEIPLQAIPNQTLSVQLDNNQYDIKIAATMSTTADNGTVAADVLMCVDIVRNNVTIVSGFRAVDGTPIIPYQYLEANSGNFQFLTSEGDYPDYRKFGIDQSLIYASATELEILRGT
jgi:hypothetical protein